MSAVDDPLALPTAADVDEAALRLAGVALHTPLLTSAALDAMTGGRIFLKAETLQRTGSFQFRRAHHKLPAIPTQSRASRRGRGTAARDGLRNRDAAGCTACQTGTHGGIRRRNRALRSIARRS